MTVFHVFLFSCLCSGLALLEGDGTISEARSTVEGCPWGYKPPELRCFDTELIGVRHLMVCGMPRPTTQYNKLCGTFDELYDHAKPGDILSILNATKHVILNDAETPPALVSFDEKQLGDIQQAGREVGFKVMSSRRNRSWTVTDFKCPEHVQFASFVQSMVRELPHSVPVVVAHCAAGVGRTGQYLIALKSYLQFVHYFFGPNGSRTELHVSQEADSEAACFPPSLLGIVVEDVHWCWLLVEAVTFVQEHYRYDAGEFESGCYDKLAKFVWSLFDVLNYASDLDGFLSMTSADHWQPEKALAPPNMQNKLEKALEFYEGAKGVYGAQSDNGAD